MEHDLEILEFIQEALLELKTAPNERPADAHEAICRAGTVSGGLNGYQLDEFNEMWLAYWNSNLDEDDAILRELALERFTPRDLVFKVTRVLHDKFEDRVDTLDEKKQIEFWVKLESFWIRLLGANDNEIARIARERLAGTGNNSQLANQEDDIIDDVASSKVVEGLDGPFNNDCTWIVRSAEDVIACFCCWSQMPISIDDIKIGWHELIVTSKYGVEVWRESHTKRVEVSIMRIPLGYAMSFRSTYV